MAQRIVLRQYSVHINLSTVIQLFCLYYFPEIVPTEQNSTGVLHKTFGQSAGMGTSAPHTGYGCGTGTDAAVPVRTLHKVRALCRFSV